MYRKYHFIHSFFVLLCIFTFSKITFAEPPNLELLLHEVRSYHDKGAYQRDLTQTAIHADDDMKARVKENTSATHPQKLAIVLDIDETSLSNYDRMAARDFLSNKKKFHQDILAADAPAIKPILLFYQDAQKHGVSVFFVTGRGESARGATIKNLTMAGFKKWDGLYMKPNSYRQPSNIPFKTNARKEITQKGYTIIASLGDQESDLKGGYAEKTYKLPNPYYFVR